MPDIYVRRISFQVRLSILTQAEAMCQLRLCELEVLSLGYEDGPQLRRGQEKTNGNQQA
ncbi:protein of unknown function [Caballeronia sp. S22]